MGDVSAYGDGTPYTYYMEPAGAYTDGSWPTAVLAMAPSYADAYGDVYPYAYDFADEDFAAVPYSDAPFAASPYGSLDAAYALPAAAPAHAAAPLAYDYAYVSPAVVPPPPQVVPASPGFLTTDDAVVTGIRQVREAHLAPLSSPAAHASDSSSSLVLCDTVALALVNLS